MSWLRKMGSSNAVRTAGSSRMAVMRTLSIDIPAVVGTLRIHH